MLLFRLILHIFGLKSEEYLIYLLVYLFKYTGTTRLPHDLKSSFISNLCIESLK